MRLQSKISKWVNSFPIESTKQALKQVALTSKGPFDKPREMNFTLYNFTQGPALEEAVARISDKGWSCSTQSQADDTSKTLLTAKKMQYKITEEQFTQDMLYFRRIADLYEVGYDGWLASN